MAGGSAVDGGVNEERLEIADARIPSGQPVQQGLSGIFLTGASVLPQAQVRHCRPEIPSHPTVFEDPVLQARLQAAK